MGVSDLVYKLRADGTQLGRELKKSEGAFGSFAKRARRSLNTAAVGLAGLTTGVGAMTKDAIDGIDTLQKLADRAGLAAEDMGALELATSLGDATIEGLTRGIGQLSRQMETGSKVFKKYGIEARNSDGSLRATMDVVKDVADQVQKLGPGAEATALAMDVFGRSGQDLLPMLLQGSEGLEQMREEADRLGLTFDEKTGRAAEKFNDDLARMKLALTGVFRQVAGDILPVLSAYANSLLTSSTETERLGKTSSALANVLRSVFSIVEGVRGAFVILAKSVSIAFAVIGVGLEATGDKLAILADGFRAAYAAFNDGDHAGVSKATDQMFAAMNRVGLKAQARVKAMWATFNQEIEDAAFKYGSTIENLWKDIELTPPDPIESPKIKPPTIPEGLEDKIAKIATMGTDAVAKAMAAAQEKADRFWKSIEEEGARVFERTRTPLERFNAEIKRLAELLGYGVISADTYLRAVRDLSDGLKEVEKQAKGAGDALRNIGEQAARQLADELESLLFDPFEERTHEMVEQFARAMARMAFQAASTAIIGAAFGAPTGGGAPGFASGGYVSGPGTGTSDSILARLSDGEYVVRARAVDHYGAAFLDRLNNMAAPRRPAFAEGGRASASGASDGPPITIANLFSEDELERFLSSRTGERVLVNVLRRTGLV